jgi:hypothetical protein
MGAYLGGRLLYINYMTSFGSKFDRIVGQIWLKEKKSLLLLRVKD